MPAESVCLSSNHRQFCGIFHRPRLAVLFIGLASVTQLAILLPAAPTVAGRAEPCIQMHRVKARISRKQLEIVTWLRQGVLWEDVVQMIGAPYCQLPPTPQAPRRDAYPLAFDPTTWLVLEYDRAMTFRGYDFTFNNQQAGGF